MARPRMIAAGLAACCAAAPVWGASRGAELTRAGLQLRQEVHSASNIVKELDEKVLDALTAVPEAGETLGEIHQVLGGVSADSSLFYGGIGPDLFIALRKLEDGARDVARAPTNCAAGTLSQWDFAVIGHRALREGVEQSVRARGRVKDLRDLEEKLAAKIEELRRGGDPRTAHLDLLLKEYRSGLARIAAHLDSGLRPPALYWDVTAGGPDCPGAAAPVRPVVYTPPGAAARNAGAARFVGGAAAARPVAANAGAGHQMYVLPGGAAQGGAAAPVGAGARAAVAGKGGTLADLEAYERSSYGSSYPILSREEWGARKAKRGAKTHSPSRLTVHHTAGRHATTSAEGVRGVKGAQNFHMDTRGWRDIGYHFLIDSAGRVYEGVPVELVGTHVANNNAGNLGMSLMGNFETQKPTADQLGSLERLASFLTARFRIDAVHRLLAHRHYNSTACPGRNVVAALDQLRTAVVRRAAALTGQMLAKGGGTGFVPLVVVQPRT